MKKKLANLALRIEVKKKIPESFNEKLKFKAAFDRRKILVTFADKIAAREYVAQQVGEKYLTRPYYLGYAPEEINWDEVPREFVLKTNHGSGGIVIVNEKANREHKLPKNLANEGWTRYQIHPDSLDLDDLVKLAKRYLSLDYSWFPNCGRIPEWPYSQIKPGIIVEELLNVNDGDLPLDIKFFMFNGECVFINQIERPKFDMKTGKMTPIYGNLMSPEWNRINVVKEGWQNSPGTPKKPMFLDEMLKMSQKLSSGIDFVRVDLYELKEKVVFGELTNFPMGAMNKFNPESYDFELGAKLFLDNY